MNTQLLTDYASLVEQENALKERKEILRGQILGYMVENNIENEKHLLGKFSVSRLKKWAYPEEVLAIGEEFKSAKAKAESTGEATYVEEPSLRFTPIKI